MKDIFIATMLTIIMILNFFDVLTDISLGVPTWHIIEEGIIVIVSAFVALYLFSEVRKRANRIHELREHISIRTEQLQHMSDEMKNARHNYSELIYKQFIDWKLTQSEQDVAMLMLKGLSLKEISGVRETKEKTVRQQASSIYEKANVEGRHDLAAYFFEDFLNS